MATASTALLVVAAFGVSAAAGESASPLGAVTVDTADASYLVRRWDRLHVAAAAESVSFFGVPPWLETPKSWESVLAPPDEPGGRFVMEGRLIGADGRTGMPGVKMFAYHADRDGLYARAARHYARLAGVLTTDGRGRYRIVSALPGSYGGAPHVHLEAWGPDLPLRVWTVSLYRGPKEKPDSLWGRMSVHPGPVHTKPQPGDDRPGHLEANVTRAASGAFQAQCDVYWDIGVKAAAHDDSTRRGLIVR